ncbi:MAG: hypothetical protein JO057_27040 [Chloroflexi bacterium]|nr:hypothetical protein [Chloroflexota bacterium]
MLQHNLADVYGSVDHVDLFIGGLAEDHARGAEVGPTFQIIIAREFDALRHGDRFYWQNQRFDPWLSARIADTRLGDIIKRNTDTSMLQPDVFKVSGSVHVPVPTPGGHGSIRGRSRGWADSRLDFG